MENKVTYAEFISNIINTRGQFGIDDSEIFEQHHILPACIGGLGDYKNGKFKSKVSRHPNCIRLYPREHFIAHKLLALENPHNPKLVWAWQAMFFTNNTYKRYEPTPEEYEQRKILLYKCGLSEATRIKLSAATKGKNNGMYGKHHSVETKEKIRKANLGKKLVWWNNGVTNTMSVTCPGDSWVRGRLGGFKHKSNKNYSKIRLGVAIKKYLWLLPDGTTKIMDRSNATKWHKDWKLIKEIISEEEN